MEDNENIYKFKKFIKENISANKFSSCTVDINTKNDLYYKIRIICKNMENMEEKITFFEYIVKKDGNNINYIFHYLSNESILDTNEKKNVGEEKHHFQDIIKIFYYNEWNTISDKNIENHLNQTFGNINDFYEILNKEYYYTYIIKDDKLKFLSKGKIKSKEQIHDENINKILYDNDKKYVLIYNNKNNSKNCENGLKCINPKCVYDHPKDYNLITSYKQYILDEKNKEIKFKSINCKYTDKLCNKHKYNKCIFKHDSDPI
jgi:hypothetical protein